MPSQPDNAQTIISRLQREQMEHDNKFHRDITHLPLQRRLTHMVLHFCKYTGQLASLRDDQKEAEHHKQTITDTFIIAMCSANSLNIALADQLEASGLESFGDLYQYALYLERRTVNQAFDSDWALRTLAIESGHIARACEKLDHLEDFPFRKVIADAVLALCRAAIIQAKNCDLDLQSAVTRRWAEIRSRNHVI
jgi:hypothetical protein